MSSRYAPVDSNGLQFAEGEIWATQKVSKKGGTYWGFDLMITPFTDGQPEQIEKYSFTYFGEESKEVTWPSMRVVLGITPDGKQDSAIDEKLITGPGEMPKKFWFAYGKPALLIPADLKWYTENNKLNDLKPNAYGQLCKTLRPVKFEKLYSTKEEMEAGYFAYKASEPETPQAPAPVATPEYSQALMMLPAFVSNSGLDLDKLAGMLQHPPFSTLGFTLDSKEVKHEVAKAVVAKAGPTDDNAIKGLLISLNGGGYLDLESEEIKTAREGIAF